MCGIKSNIYIFLSTVFYSVTFSLTVYLLARALFVALVSLFQLQLSDNMRFFIIENSGFLFWILFLIGLIILPILSKKISPSNFLIKEI